MMRDGRAYGQAVSFLYRRAFNFFCVFHLFLIFSFIFLSNSLASDFQLDPSKKKHQFVNYMFLGNLPVYKQVEASKDVVFPIIYFVDSSEIPSNLTELVSFGDNYFSPVSGVMGFRKKKISLDALSLKFEMMNAVKKDKKSKGEYYNAFFKPNFIVLDDFSDSNYDKRIIYEFEKGNIIETRTLLDGKCILKRVVKDNYILKTMAILSIYVDMKSKYKCIAASFFYHYGFSNMQEVILADDLIYIYKKRNEYGLNRRMYYEYFTFLYGEQATVEVGMKKFDVREIFRHSN